MAGKNEFQVILNFLPYFIHAFLERMVLFQQQRMEDKS